MSKLTDALTQAKSIEELSNELNVKSKVIPVYLSKLRKSGVKLTKTKVDGVTKYAIGQ